MWRTAAAVALAASICSPVGAQDGLTASLERLAAKGDAEAAYHVGMAYHTGSGVERDYAKALAAFRQAAAAGDPLGAYKLGCYHAGQGEGIVAPDPKEALRYKLVAARAGYALAQEDVASHYARRGDKAVAVEWLSKAAAQGSPGALMTMASIYNGASGIKPSPARAAAYFRLFVDRTGGGDGQSRWLATLEQKLTSAERAEAATIVRTYRPAPTALTIKALSGRRAAEVLVGKR